MSNAFDKGATELEISLQHQPDDPLTLVGLAHCYTGKGQVQKAADLLDAALAKQAGTAGMLTERGKIALLMDQPKEAEPWLRKALARPERYRGDVPAGGLLDGPGPKA